MTTTEHLPRRSEVRVDRGSGARYLAVSERGVSLRDDAILNKGTCFTREERALLGLWGLLPPGVSTVEEQEARAYGNYLKAQGDVARYLFLAGLHDRNETLFFRLLVDHLEEMAPIVYTPTVGKACEQYSHIYRRPRGLYVSLEDRGHIAELLGNAPSQDVRVIVVTDNEAILGIGDQGVGGMGIAIGKLALYTAGAGIHPAQCLPLDLDVGTDNERLLEDPLYLGVRQRRLRGEGYFALLDELVEAIGRRWPNALLQWEDFASQNAFTILERYRGTILSFNDDIQGTGAVVVAGIHGALRVAARALEDERIVFFGAGASGVGSALAVRRALREQGVPEAQIGRRVLCLDSRGLILSDRPELAGAKQMVAADPTLAAGWSRTTGGPVALGDVVRHFKPTVLIGVSGQPGFFSEDIVRSMHRGCPRPIIFPLSNPTSRTEAAPADLLKWTDGAAIVATGSPFPPVVLRGQEVPIGQSNNVLIFPGVGLGASAVGARSLPDQAFDAAARALFEFTVPGLATGVPVYPPLSRLRELSRAVAAAVARTLVALEAAPALSDAEIERRIDAARWEPVYLPYRPM